MLSDDIYDKAKELRVEMVKAAQEDNTEQFGKLLQQILNVALGSLIDEIKTVEKYLAKGGRGITNHRARAKQIEDRVSNAWDFAARQLEKESLPLLAVGGLRKYITARREE